MKLLSLELQNFRNYKSAFVEFGDGLNILFGENASGKTNMLESIFLSSIFHSPRTTKDKDMILLGENRATVKLNIQKRFRKHKIFLQIDEKSKKRVAIDGIPVSRAGELLGVLGVVYFSPDEMKLVKESPLQRRRFLDVGLSQQQKSYFKALQRYNKILKQKNNLLKDSRYAQNLNDMLEVWDLSLAKEGEILIKKRIEFINELNETAKVIHSKLSREKECLTLSYETTINTENVDLQKELYENLKNSREKDKKLGYSSVGPHRDDIKIEINGKDSRKFASQGQQRTIALSLKLGEVELYKTEIGETPILLLDDVLSELDENRQNILLEITQNYQTFITCTEYNLKQPANLYNVLNGTIKSVD